MAKALFLINFIIFLINRINCSANTDLAMWLYLGLVKFVKNSNYVSCITITALFLFVSSAFAQSNIKSPEGKYVFDQTASLASESQNYISSYYESNKQKLDQSASLLSQKQSSYTKLAKEQTTIVANINAELDKSILNLYAADTKIAIIPEIVGLNNGLLQMTDSYKDQVYSLYSGPYFQKKRDTLSLMIAELRKDLLNTKAVIIDRRKTVEKIRDELIEIAGNSSSPIVQLGFDHFINLRISLLSNQSLILSDISRINQGKDLDNVNDPIYNLCHGVPIRFSSFLAQNGILLNYTQGWSSLLKEQINYDVNLWKTKRTSDNDPYARNSLEDIDGMLGGFTAKNGIYYPGEIQGWDSCSGTKTNIYNDLKTKIATEISRGNRDSAIELELLANDLAVEINRLNGQSARLRQLKDLYAKMGDVAVTNAYKDSNSDLTPAYWKTAVSSHAKNLADLSSVENVTLIAARKLVKLAQVQVESLGKLTNSDDIKANLFPVSSRLDAIIDEGFGRLERELDSSADSLGVMSANVKSSANTTGEGGLAESIETYRKIVAVRTTQMQNEANNKLPKEKSDAELKVVQTQNSRTEALALQRSIEQKIESLAVLQNQYKSISAQFKTFFSINNSHPVYNSIVNKYINELNPPKKTKSEVVKGLSTFIIKFKTVSSVSTQSSNNLCSGKNASSCKKIQKSKLGKKAQNLKKNYSKSLVSLIDAGSAVLLGQSNLTILASSINTLLATLNAA